MTNKRFLALGHLAVAVLCLSACGGGGSSDDGMLIEGTLTEAGGADHSLSLVLRHDEGARIEEVEICALGQCSTTDGAGQWGFVAPESFSGGAVSFTVVGHGIDTTTVVEIPADAGEVFLDLQHVEGGLVEAAHITVDGETTHNEEHHEHDESTEE